MPDDSAPENGRRDARAPARPDGDAESDGMGHAAPPSGPADLPGHEPLKAAPWTLTLRNAEGAPVWSASLPSRLLPRIRASALLLGVGAAALVGSWAVLAARTAQIPAMERELAALSQEDDQVQRLAEALADAEASYERLRGLFADDNMATGALWLPPAGAASGSAAARAAGSDGAPPDGPPSLWPLTERGFLTRGLATPPGGEEGGSAHPGIDVAVPSGSYIRAVGAGRIVERGEDPVYGLFVVVEHAGGYRSLYGHASVVVVEPGRDVRRGEVLGLSGSSGMSSAPHLHLEITLDGEHLDPLALLSRPGGP